MKNTIVAKETGFILLGLVLIACFVRGFSDTFSFLGRFADTAGVVVFLVLIDIQLRRENKYESIIDDLERRNKYLSEKLQNTQEEMLYYRKIAEGKDRE